MNINTSHTTTRLNKKKSNCIEEKEQQKFKEKVFTYGQNNINVIYIFYIASTFRYIVICIFSIRCDVFYCALPLYSAYLGVCRCCVDVEKSTFQLKPFCIWNKAECLRYSPLCCLRCFPFILPRVSETEMNMPMNSTHTCTCKSKHTSMAMHSPYTTNQK